MSDTPESAIILTDKAAEKIRELLAGQEDASEQALRVAVRGGGCSGFQFAACGCGSSFQVREDADQQTANV
jgi:Fe-S cluster assembly iron-binding protein IscA